MHFFANKVKAAGGQNPRGLGIVGEDTGGQRRRVKLLEQKAGKSCNRFTEKS